MSDANDDTPRLYNLDQEIGERTNLADKHPEIVAKMKVLMDQMNAEFDGKNSAARRPAGKAKNPQGLYPFEEKARQKNKKKS